MWIDAYVAETLVRDRIAEAHRRAARRQLLRREKPSRRPRRYWAVVQQLMQQTLTRGRRLVSRARRRSPGRADDRRPLIVPAPDALAVQMHAAQPAIDAVERDRIRTARVHVAAGVGQMETALRAREERNGPLASRAT